MLRPLQKILKRHHQTTIKNNHAVAVLKVFANNDHRNMANVINKWLSEQNQRAKPRK